MEMTCMENIVDFLSTALPWIAMALLLAIFAVRESGTKKKQEKQGEYGTEGMALGVCLGVAISTAIHINVGIGMIAGMVLGLLIGSGVKKKDE